MTPDEELADLQKKYALLEGDRKAYYETSQWTIKQNRETIANGKEENKELRLQLGACQSAKGGKPDGGDTETAELEKLINYAKDLRKKYDEIRLLTSKKQGQLNIKLDKIKDLERDAVRATDDGSPAMRHIRLLENRLDKALIKYNEAQSIRRTYEQIVKKLREERIGFDNQTGSLERALKAKERDLEELTLMSNEANHAKDHAKLELLEVDKWLANERVVRDKEINLRRDQVKFRQEMNAKMQAREAERKRMAMEAAGDMSKEEEDGLKRNLMAKRLQHEANERQMEAMAARIVTFEEAFKKIKEATGVADVNEVIQKFMTQEDTHNNLKQITTESQTRLDHLHAERATITQQLELLKYSGSRTDGSRPAVDDYEARLSVAEEVCETERVKFERVAKTLVASKAGIAHLADKLDGLPLTEGKAVKLTEDSMVEVLTQSQSKLLAAYGALMASEQAAALLASAAGSTVGAEDLPAHNSRIGDDNAAAEEEEAEDDDGSDTEDVLDVPDRDYVKTSALQVTLRKGKKKKGLGGDTPPDSPMNGKASMGGRPAMS